MSSTAGSIITVNAGSSSIKLAVFAEDQRTLQTSPLVTLSISNIGQPVSMLQVREAATPTHTEEVQAPSHIEASHILMDRLAPIIPAESIVAIGHRLVHGGSNYTRPTAVENVTEKDWELLSQLDPEHTPAARQLIMQLAERYPSVMQIACFDTAFFHDLPKVAKIIPIPKKYYDQGVRRYGFHGLSYMSLLATFQEKAGETAANGRVVVAHLGSGASLAAIKQGKPVDTTMGFTPTSGIAMSTRSGDLDPNIFGFLHRQNNMTVDEFNRMVSAESGLLGISQLTGDMHALLNAEKENEAAATAVELFVRDVKKSIGALAAVLGGVDSLLFSGGIGEQSAVLRERICQGLEYMGIDLNHDANQQHAFLVSSERSRVGVHVIPTNEAQVIAAQTKELLNEGGRE